MPDGRDGLVRGVITEIGEQRTESVSTAGGDAVRSLVGGAALAVPRALGVVLALLFAPLRVLLVPSLLGGRRAPDRPDRVQVPVTPFVVLDTGGRRHDCMLRGEVRGGFLRLGDEVEVHGRPDRMHVVRARRVHNVASGAVVLGWVDPRARASGLRAAVALIVLVVGILLLLGLLMSWGTA